MTGFFVVAVYVEFRFPDFGRNDLQFMLQADAKKSAAVKSETGGRAGRMFHDAGFQLKYDVSALRQFFYHTGDEVVVVTLVQQRHRLNVDQILVFIDQGKTALASRIYAKVVLQ